MVVFMFAIRHDESEKLPWRVILRRGFRARSELVAAFKVQADALAFVENYETGGEQPETLPPSTPSKHQSWSVGAFLERKQRGFKPHPPTIEF